MAGLYTKTLLDEMERALYSLTSNWGFGSDVEIELLNISENATFLAREGQRKAVFRVHRPGYHTLDEIKSELSWIEALRSAETVVTPAPLAQRRGGSIATFDLHGEERAVVAFEFMPGAEPSLDTDLSSNFRALGGTNARLHCHAREWTRPEGFTRKSWNFETTLGAEAHWGDWRAALGLTANGRAILQRTCDALRAQLNEIGEEPDQFGLIHADLRLANLLVEDDRLTVIDFDDCGFGWYLYDFAAAISFHETDPQIPALQAAWVEGYREVAPLSDQAIEQMPVFIMLRRMLLTAWIASHSETPTAQELGASYTDGTIEMAQHFLETSSKLVR